MTEPVLEIETTEIMAGHGYVRTPRSRVIAAHEDPSLGAKVPEPQSIERPKGFPAYTRQHNGQTLTIPPDGQLMSAGIEPYKDLDGPVSPSGQPWPAMPVTPGGTIRMSWWLTAQHKTQKWHYYITKDSADLSKPLTRDMLEPLCEIWWLHGPNADQFWTAPFPVKDVHHWIKMPTKQGRHIIYAVWDVADTANAFYQGIDVDFSPNVKDS
ncbi:chitin-binding protein [Saccharopolyspora lacisalsi]|uniref:Chitin-binding protein n=1 Tax=Halosaccharopolyspora lacisalsi TaxID=1000566 RepID=A0A839E9I6_9PSEU|nr:lytic polysaccharide monooxygenase auxiliary activity family 9 protein [Halosaccharopolyspora lacisalsi]MBA8827921.1 chitin-binding protein [Halosaccharopolyspora lacisalsi]